MLSPMSEPAAENVYDVIVIGAGPAGPDGYGLDNYYLALSRSQRHR